MGIGLWELLNEYKVVIPIIQRDYAQGRMTGKVPLIRKNILNSIFDTINEDGASLQLDFIYGFTEDSLVEKNSIKRTFYPLDGQQRLTTLFLLHWYIAVNEGRLKEASSVLANFTYETRHSSRVFCSKLVQYQPEDLSSSISESIVNQPWFFTAWNNDPTISSMLTMLNAIQDNVKERQLDNIWHRLVSQEPAIEFHLLPMDELGLPDDLYIKMNSRGKELTDFEYYKVRLSEAIHPYRASEFNHKIDQEWYDLFWDFYKNDEVRDIAQRVDSGFLRFFRYITDIMIEENNIENVQGLEELELFDKIYSSKNNTDYIFKLFDTLVKHNKENHEFFSTVFYIDEKDYTKDKTRIFFVNSSVNLFKKCADFYNPKLRNNPFSIGEQLLLYACLVHILNNTDEFISRIRKIRNLIANSEDTVRKENMGSLLKTVKTLVIEGEIDKDSKFSNTQIIEEEKKEQYLKMFPDMKETLFKLEDHHLLQGCTSLFQLTPELGQYTRQFYDVFSEDCDYESISRALFIFGDYTQRNSWRTFLGNKNSSTWRELFTPSQRRNRYENTSKVVYALLDELILNPDKDIESLIKEFLLEFELDLTKEKDWRYYFVYYPGFRIHEDGFYYWPDETKQYECIMLRRKTTGGFHWDPFLVSIRRKKSSLVTLESYGAPLIFVKDDAAIRITSRNQGYVLEAVDDEGNELINKATSSGLVNQENLYQIKQSDLGIDIEDRVVKGAELIEELNKL